MFRSGLRPSLDMLHFTRHAPCRDGLSLLYSQGTPLAGTAPPILYSNARPLPGRHLPFYIQTHAPCRDGTSHPIFKRTPLAGTAPPILRPHIPTRRPNSSALRCSFPMPAAACPLIIPRLSRVHKARSTSPLTAAVGPTRVAAGGPLRFVCCLVGRGVWWCFVAGLVFSGVRVSGGRSRFLSGSVFRSCVFVRVPGRGPVLPGSRPPAVRLGGSGRSRFPWAAWRALLASRGGGSPPPG